MTARSLIFDHVAVLGDQTRCRILQLLERQELMVSELCSVLQLPQSTVSRHLRQLLDGGWVTARREGTSNFYAIDVEKLGESAGRLWRVIRDEMTAMAQSEQDGQRLEAILTERRTRSQEFFSSAADEWDRVRDQLFGVHFDLVALPGLLDPSWVVGDLACGTGRVAATVAPHVGRVIAVDSSAAMLKAARERLNGQRNVEIHEGALERLPIEDSRLDVAVLFLALHHVPEPARVLREAQRVLRAGGRLLVVDMTPHDHADYQQQMGHVWLGFSEEQMKKQLAAAGFERIGYKQLPADPAAMGPILFSATATKPQKEAPARSSTARQSR